MYNKKCDICGRDFIADKNHPRQKYCSQECKRKRKMLKKCKNCGKEFVGTRKTRYCNDCHNLQCIYCGKKYYGNPGGKFCCRKCCDLYKIYHEVNKICPICGKELIGPYGGRKYCSEECSLLGRNKNTASTCNEKYGVPYVIMRKDLQEKNGKTKSACNTKIGKELQSLGFNVEYEYHLGGKIFDFKVGDVLIEYDPTYTHSVDIKTHYENHNITIGYHKDKTSLAMKNGFRCIHIFQRDDLNQIQSLLNQTFDLGNDIYNIDMAKDDYMYLLKNGYKLIHWTSPEPILTKFRGIDVNVYNCGRGTFKKNI